MMARQHTPGALRVTRGSETGAARIPDRWCCCGRRIGPVLSDGWMSSARRCDLATAQNSAMTDRQGPTLPMPPLTVRVRYSLRHRTSSLRLGTWIGVAHAVLAIDNTERLKALKVPTLVIWGVWDTTFPGAPDQNAPEAVLDAAAEAKHTTIYGKQYGFLPLPSSGAQESDIGHVVQWDAPSAIAADIAAFVETGAPTRDLPHRDRPPSVSHILVEPGRATALRFGS